MAGVGAIQAVGWMNNEGINNFYINCTVKDKSLDCQGISLEVMIFIAAEGISAKEERHCRQVCSNRINPFKNSDIQISICNIRGRGLF